MSAAARHRRRRNRMGRCRWGRCVRSPTTSPTRPSSCSPNTKPSGAHVGAVAVTAGELGDGPLATPRRNRVRSRTGRPTPRPIPAPVPGGAGRWRLDADLDTEGGALLDTAIRHAITRDVEGEPVRSPARRRADALVDVVRWYLDHNNDNAIARRRTHLDVIITIDALQHGQGGELPDGTLLDPNTMARLACDADVHRVVMDRSSTVLDYGRRARIVPNGLREALNVRDRHCRFSDCDRPPAWCEAHPHFRLGTRRPHQTRQPRFAMQPPSPHPPPRRLETLPPPRQHIRSPHPRRPPIRKPTTPNAPATSRGTPRTQRRLE